MVTALDRSGLGMHQGGQLAQTLGSLAPDGLSRLAISPSHSLSHSLHLHLHLSLPSPTTATSVPQPRTAVSPGRQPAPTFAPPYTPSPSHLVGRLSRRTRHVTTTRLRSAPSIACASSSREGAQHPIPVSPEETMQKASWRRDWMARQAVHVAVASHGQEQRYPPMR